jgi:hypothetical protein
MSKPFDAYGGRANHGLVLLSDEKRRQECRRSRPEGPLHVQKDILEWMSKYGGLRASLL